MSAVKSFFYGAVILVLLLVLSSIYTVREGQNALLLRLGKMVRNPVTNEVSVQAPGIHFKFPVIYVAKVFDTRLQTLDIKSSRIVTKEKKDVLVDYYVKWRIKDLPRYFTSTGANEIKAQTLLEQKVNDGLRAEFGKRTISDVVSGERSRIMQDLQIEAKKDAHSLGIDVIDVRIKRIDLPSEVSKSVFARMRAERERIANEHRAQGKSEAEFIKANADREVTVILATASKKAKILRGEGDAKAAKIYANAYNKDADFYAFTRSLKAYNASFKSKNDILVLKPDSQFFKYFNKATTKK